MSEINTYVLVDENDVQGDWEYDLLQNAINAAASATRSGEPTAVIERTYVYDDSELVWAPGGAETWPPEKPESYADQHRGFGSNVKPVNQR